MSSSNFDGKTVNGKVRVQPGNWSRDENSIFIAKVVPPLPTNRETSASHAEVPKPLRRHGTSECHFPKGVPEVRVNF